LISFLWAIFFFKFNDFNSTSTTKTWLEILWQDFT
jgi:hypothetical protein